VREEVERRRVVKEEKKKRTLKYIQQLWDKVLKEDTALLEGIEGSHIMRSKCKETLLRDNADYQPFKKAKGKQLARYRENIRIKIGGANPCERCMTT